MRVHVRPSSPPSLARPKPCDHAGGLRLFQIKYFQNTRKKAHYAANRSADWQSAVSPVGLARRSVLAKAGNRRSERNRTNPDGFLMERGIHSASPPLGTTNLGLSDDKRRNPTFALIPHSALVQISCTFDFKLSTLIIEPAPKRAHHCKMSKNSTCQSGAVSLRARAHLRRQTDSAIHIPAIPALQLISAFSSQNHL